jgi:Raf kinase inhibitor-like YbhB/YbcL family protein
LTLTTDAFEDGGIIPNKFTMAAEGPPVSPKLTWTYVPEGTVSFALILHDPDTAPMKKTDEVLHWLIFNIPGTAHELPEGVPAQAQLRCRRPLTWVSSAPAPRAFVLSLQLPPKLKPELRSTISCCTLGVGRVSDGQTLFSDAPICK